MNLRKKWNTYFKNRCLERVSFLNKEDVLILDNNNKIFSEEFIDKYKSIILLEPLNKTFDLIDFFSFLRKKTSNDCKIFFFYFSKRWFLIFKFLEFFKITDKIDNDEFSYIDEKKINLYLTLCDYTINAKINVSNFLFNLKPLNFFFNFFNTMLPFFDIFSFCKIQSISSLTFKTKKKLTTSVIIPCKNEQDNIDEIFKELEKIKYEFEAIFVDDKSTDNSREVIKENSLIYKKIDTKIVNGPGVNKYQSVRAGVLSSSKDICVILDADLAVKGNEINKCINLLQKKNIELVNCSRFFYRMKNFSMKFLNYIGNKFFAFISGLIVSDTITDTLCGTKAFYRKDWEKFERFSEFTKNYDKWGDFNIILGAYYYCMKYQELPIRYHARKKGYSKMTKRLWQGVNMLINSFFAFLKFNK